MNDIAPTDADFEKRVRQYIELRDKIATIREEHKKQLEPFNSMLQTLNGKLLQMLQAVSADNVGTQYGTVYRRTEASATIQDADAFWAFVLGHGTEYADVRANKTTVKEWVAKTGAAPPGVKYSTNVVVGVQKK